MKSPSFLWEAAWGPCISIPHSSCCVCPQEEMVVTVRHHAELAVGEVRCGAGPLPVSFEAAPRCSFSLVLLALGRSSADPLNVRSWWTRQPLPRNAKGCHGSYCVPNWHLNIKGYQKPLHSTLCLASYYSLK